MLLYLRWKVGGGKTTNLYFDPYLSPLFAPSAPLFADVCGCFRLLFFFPFFKVLWGRVGPSCGAPYKLPPERCSILHGGQAEIYARAGNRVNLRTLRQDRRHNAVMTTERGCCPIVLSLKTKPKMRCLEVGLASRTGLSVRLADGLGEMWNRDQRSTGRQGYNVNHGTPEASILMTNSVASLDSYPGKQRPSFRATSPKPTESVEVPVFFFFFSKSRSKLELRIIPLPHVCWMAGRGKRHGAKHEFYKVKIDRKGALFNSASTPNLLTLMEGCR